MTVDYKGQFLLGNHQYCYPLTIVDHVSRYLLACDAFLSTEQGHTRRVFERVFRQHGLPRAILSDNGSPFGSPGLARLSRLSLWWIRLGINVERIVPGHPEQNGAHERMHRTLKAQTTRPPETTLKRQQVRFDRFIDEYNNERPHEALGQKRPATLYTPSPRPYPESLPPIEYPGHLEIRKVDDRGTIRWKNEKLFLSHTLLGEMVGLEEVDDGVWSLYYSSVLLARFDERDGGGSMDDRSASGTDPRRQHSAKRASQSRRRHRFGGCIITGDSERADAPRFLLAYRDFGTAHAMPTAPRSVTHVPGLFCYPCRRLIRWGTRAGHDCEWTRRGKQEDARRLSTTLHSMIGIRRDF